MRLRVESSKVRVPSFLAKFSVSQVGSSAPSETADRGDVLCARLHQRSSHAQLSPECAPFGRQDLRLRKATAIDCVRNGLRVDRIILTLVLSRANGPDPSRIQHARIVSPSSQCVVDIPALSAGLEGYASWRALRPDSRVQLGQRPYGRAVDHFAILHLAIRNEADAQIKSYAAHGLRPFSPWPRDWGSSRARPRWGVGSLRHRPGFGHLFAWPLAGARAALETPRDRSQGCSSRDGQRARRFRLRHCSHRFIESPGAMRLLAAGCAK